VVNSLPLGYLISLLGGTYPCAKGDLYEAVDSPPRSRLSFHLGSVERQDPDNKSPFSLRFVDLGMPSIVGAECSLDGSNQRPCYRRK
jgi:hypothetical protein